MKTILAGIIATLVATHFSHAASPDAPAPATHGLVVHEWGTFTSVQGADGVLMSWRPLETAGLPKFVYDWSHPGYNRVSAQMAFGKGGLATLQRMETPVIYFYSDEEITANVSVKFPKGFITEWYPQARQIGPAVEKQPPVIAQLDSVAHKAGVKPTFTFASLLPQHAVADSRIVWSDVRVLPAKQHAGVAAMISFEKSGNHYFAARETDADFLRVSALAPTNSDRITEHDKFLFYRGAGSFETPFKLTASAAGAVTVENCGLEPLASLFLLNVRDGSGRWTLLESLAPGAKREFPGNSSPPANAGSSRTDAFKKEIGTAMQSALVRAGLFDREARAMVSTWRESWFADEGVRVLYLLPRRWTDETLPMDIQPKPDALVRVMVGRAEVLTPDRESRLREELTKANAGDVEARAAVVAEFKKLGRFGLPAYQRLISQSPDTKFNQLAWTLLQEAGKTAAGGSGTAGARLSSSVF